MTPAREDAQGYSLVPFPFYIWWPDKKIPSGFFVYQCLLGVQKMYNKDVSLVESFNFNGKHVRSVYVKDVDQCLVSKDVYEVIGYDKEDGAKVIQRLFPEKYKIRFGNAKVDLECVDNSVYTQSNMLLLRKPGLYCFLLRCKSLKLNYLWNAL